VSVQSAARGTSATPGRKHSTFYVKWRRGWQRHVERQLNAANVTCPSSVSNTVSHCVYVEIFLFIFCTVMHSVGLFYAAWYGRPLSLCLNAHDCNCDIYVINWIFLRIWLDFRNGTFERFSLIYCQTRLPSNLRPITHECLHLVMRAHFWSHDKDGGHTIRSTIAENPMLHAKFMTLCFREPELLPTKVLHCRNKDFWAFMLLWPWPWPDDLHVWTWPVFPGVIPDVQIWTSYVSAFESSTDRHDWNYIPRHFVGLQEVS